MASKMYVEKPNVKSTRSTIVTEAIFLSQFQTYLLALKGGRVVMVTPAEAEEVLGLEMSLILAAHDGEWLRIE